MNTMQRRKHYQERRAHAEGWELEYKKDSVTCDQKERSPVCLPSFLDNVEYRIVPDEEGWLPWYGGDEAPIEGSVDVWFRDGTIDCQGFSHWSWYHSNNNGDIVKYRPHKEEEKPVDPYAEPKAAAKDPTKQVRCSYGEWQDSGYLWVWDCPAHMYEIRDKPAEPVYEYLWVVKSASGRNFISTFFSTTIEEAKQEWRQNEIIDRCEWSKRPR